MLVSDWQVAWDPLGESPRVLLGLGDLMDDEIARALSQSVDVGKFDFARSGVPVSRRNAKDRLDFSRRVASDSDSSTWDDCQQALSDAPWALKELLKVTPRDSVDRYFTAALLSTSHAPQFDGSAPESGHAYSLRLIPRSAVMFDGIVIIGGYYAPPGHYFFPPLPPGVTIPPGKEVVISGTPGLPTGGYGLPDGVDPGGGSVVIEPLALPESTHAPAISGTPSVGLLLERTVGTWSHADSVTGQWFFKGIATGHTAGTYTVPDSAETGDSIWYRETASNLTGSATVDSNILTVIPLEFKNLVPAAIDGSIDAGDTLTATPGTWQAADSVTGEWYFNASSTGETGLSYVIPGGAVSGDTILYRETAVKSGHGDITQDSNTIVVGYDDSVLHLAPAAMWIADSGVGSPKYWTGIRELVMGIEWHGLPADATIGLEFIFPDQEHDGRFIPWDGYDPTSYDAAGSGSGSIKTSVQLLTDSFWEDGQEGDVAGVISDQVNGMHLAVGLDYLKAYENGGVPGAFPSGDIFCQDPLGWTLQVKISGTPVATWTVHPQLSAAGVEILDLDNLAPVTITETSTRKIRIDYNGSTYALRTPSNFTVT